MRGKKGPLLRSPAVAPRRRTRGRRTWPQRLLIVVNSLLAIACLSAAGVFNLIRSKAAELPVVDIGSEVRQRKDETGPRNFLFVGTDEKWFGVAKLVLARTRVVISYFTNVINRIRQVKDAAPAVPPVATW